MYVRESVGVWVQVISLHTLSPVGGATTDACEGECCSGVCVTVDNMGIAAHCK